MNRREFILGGTACAMLPSFGSAKLNECSANLDKFNAELQDLIEFSKTCTICNVEEGLVNFNPRPYQIEYFKNILKSKHLVCRKCRQCGATMMNLIYAHWMAERHPEKKVVLVFNTYNTIKYEKAKFNTMFYDDPSKWGPWSVEFTTYDDFCQTFSKIPGPGKYGKYPLYSSEYLNADTVILFDEYAFAAGILTYGKIFGLLDSPKTIWTSTPFAANDVLWGSGKTEGEVVRMKITGDQVFSAERISDLKHCLDETHFK